MGTGLLVAVWLSVAAAGAIVGCGGFVRFPNR